MLKKLLVAVLACLTIFLSKRSMTDGQSHSPDHRMSDSSLTALKLR